ncbi:MAG: type IV pilin N-terminal domain-containing protein, partial [Methanophagales archaeon]|nr:type IV pilin N-terminal domain-containing protein [Methanophagales archaeon]
MNNNRARSFMQIRSSRSKSNSRGKRGVSPVIGVILMVAATIVIAGVV